MADNNVDPDYYCVKGLFTVALGIGLTVAAILTLV